MSTLRLYAHPSASHSHQRQWHAGKEGGVRPQRALNFEPVSQSRLGPGLAAHPASDLARLSDSTSRTASPVASGYTGGATSSFDSPFSSLEASGRPAGASIWGAPGLSSQAGQGPAGLTQQQMAAEMVNMYGLACPLTKQLMRDPVVAGDGYTYERAAIESWLGQHASSPITKQPLPDSSDLVPNLTMRSAIQLLIPQH